MLKLILWLLLAVNAALFAFRMGYMDTFFVSKNEPERVTHQINADKLKLKQKPVSQPPAASASLPVVVASKPTVPSKVVACTEVGDFANHDTQKIEAQLAEMKLGERLSRRSIREVATHMVFISPQSSKKLAEKKASELKALGVTKFFIIQDNSKLKWGISLGVFKSEAAAKNHLASLKKKGVRSARVGARSVSNSRTAFVLRDLDDNSLKTLKSIMKEFPEQKARECGKI